MCGAGSWEGLSLTLKLLQIVLDGLEGCGLVADNVQRVVRRHELPFNTASSGSIHSLLRRCERFERFALTLPVVRAPNMVTSIGSDTYKRYLA